MALANPHKFLGPSTLRVPDCSCNLRKASHFGQSGFRRISHANFVKLKAPILAAIKIDRSKNIPSTTETDEVLDKDLCPVDCVREIFNQEDLNNAIESAREQNALVVVDFYRTACGSCKYIEHGYAKLCRGEGDAEHPVVFLKHNVFDEYDESTDLAEKLRIKVVPLFHFYQGGELVDKFATRDKKRLQETIDKYTIPSSGIISETANVSDIGVLDSGNLQSG